LCDHSPDTEKGIENLAVPSDSEDHRIRDGIKAEIAPMFGELRRFTDRRIAELTGQRIRLGAGAG
jgi:hypothetical protein